MKTIQVGFSIPKDHKFPIFSWAIRYLESKNFWSFSDISHAYVRWFYAHPEIMEWNTYEADGTTVHFLGNEEFTSRIQTIELYEVSIEEEGFKRALKYCIRNAGKNYGFKGALALLIPSLKRKFTGKYSESSNNDGESAQFCSEVVGRFLQAAGVDLKVNFESLSPNRLKNMFRELSQSSSSVRRVL